MSLPDETTKLMDPLPEDRDLLAARTAVETAQRHGAAHAVAVVERRCQNTISVRQGEVLRHERPWQRGARLRVHAPEGQTYTLALPDFESSPLGPAIEHALSIAATGPPDPHGQGLPAVPDALLTAQDLVLQDARIEALSAVEQTDIARSWESDARYVDPRLAVLHCRFHDRLQLTAVATSAGFAGSYRKNLCGGDLGMAVREGPRGIYLRTERWFSSFFMMRVDDFVVRLAERCARLLDPKPLARHPTTAVWLPVAATRLVTGIAAGMQADRVREGRSFLGGDDLGQPLGAAGISLIDDASLPGRMATRPHDAEGAAARRVELLTDGQVTGWLHDARSARAAGVVPTGHGTLDGIATTNLLLPPSDRGPDAMVAEMESGVLIVDVVNADGVDPLTGRVNLIVHGIQIENGQLTRPFYREPLSGDLRGMLGSMEAASDAVWIDAICVPTLRTGAVEVGG